MQAIKMSSQLWILFLINQFKCLISLRTILIILIHISKHSKKYNIMILSNNFHLQDHFSYQLIKTVKNLKF